MSRSVSSRVSAPLCLLAAVVALLLSCGLPSASGAVGTPLSSSSAAPSSGPSTGINWYNTNPGANNNGGLSSSSSAPLQAASTGLASSASASAPNANSSAGATSAAPFLTYPAGSVAAVFALIVSPGVDASSPLFAANVTAALVQTVSAFSNLSTSAVRPYVRVISINGTQLSGRRLLQVTSGVSVSFVLLGSISALNISASSAINQFAAALSAGTVLGPFGTTIPPQTLATAVVGTPASTGAAASGGSSSGGSLGGGGGGYSGRNGWNVSNCGALFASVIQPSCGLSSFNSTAAFCSLSCAAVYPAWFSNCVNNAGPLYPPNTNAYAQLQALNNGSTLAAMQNMAASCSQCSGTALGGLYVGCQVNIAQSAVAANASSLDLLYSLQFPAQCPAACAANYFGYLLPLYTNCIAPYGAAAIPANASAFLYQCAPLTAPSNVTGVAVRALSASLVAISWTPATVVKAPSDGVQYYVVRGNFVAAPAPATNGPNGPNGSNGSNKDGAAGNASTVLVFQQSYNFSAGGGSQSQDYTVVGGRTYVYGVVACNSIGCSGPSVLQLQTAVTPQAPPTAPASISVGNITATSAVVMWQPSAPVQSDNSTLFYVLSRQVLSSVVPPAGLYRGVATNFSFSDLQPNTSYVLSVVAASLLAGQSLNGSTANFTTPCANPSPVVGLFASSVQLSNIRLQWSPPLFVGAYSIAAYYVYLNNTAAGVLSLLGNSSVGQFDTQTGQAANFSTVTPYTFVVLAVNSGGLQSTQSASVTVITPANAPTVAFAIVPYVSPLGVVALTWNTSQLNNGGSPISAVHLSLSSPLDSREIDLPASAQSYNLSQLNATTQYSVTWRVMNAYGWSANAPPAPLLTLSAAPYIVAFVAGDACGCNYAFGANSTLLVQFGASVQGGGSLASQVAVDALFVFNPPIGGSYSGQWVNNNSAALITVTAVNASVPASIIGLATVMVNAALYSSGGMSASAQGQLSPPLSGSWYGAPRTARFFGANQSSIVVQQDSAFNPIFVLPAPLGASLQSTALLTLTVLRGNLSVARASALALSSASLVNSSSSSVTLRVPYSSLASALLARLVSYTPLPQSTASDVLMASVTDTAQGRAANPFDSVNLAIIITPVNHAPAIRFAASALPAWVFGQSYTLPAVVVADQDANNYPSVPLSVVLSAQSITALLTLNATVTAPATVSSSVLGGGSAPSLTLSGPLADLNAYLALQPISVSDPTQPPSVAATSVQLFVNDNGNGGGAPLTASIIAPINVTCVGTAAPAVASAMFSGDAGSLVLTFTTSFDQSATASVNCSQFFDAATLATLGASSSCPFRGMNQLVVLLGYGATLLPQQTLTFSAMPPLQRCAAGSLASGSVTVQPPASVAVPVVSISGPSTVSSCDSLTLYGQVTGLGGRPTTDTYSWSVATGATSDPSAATLNPLVLGTAATGATLSLDQTALYVSNSYYFFYLTVTNFLGASNTSSAVVFKSQLATPTLQPLGSSAITVSPSMPFFITVAPVLSQCLTGANRVMNFNWAISPPLSASSAMPVSTYPQINVPAHTLSAGNTYTFTLLGTMAVDATLNASVSFSVNVPASPIGVSIVGGSVQQSSQLVPLTLSAVAFDPDATSATGNWSFAWSCLSSAGVACQDSQLGAPLSTGVGASNASTSTLPIAAGKLAADVYTWSVLATNGARTASSSVSVSVVANPIPIVSITSYLTLVNPNGLLYYAASVYDTTNTTLSYSWTQVSGPTLALATSGVAVSLRSPNLVLNNAGASVFTAGATYAFQCAVANGYNQTSFAQVSVTINAPPFGGSLSVSPSSGVAFNTSFALSADGWQSSAGSALSYQFFAVASDSSLSQLNVRSGASVFNTQLAQGLTANVTVLVVVSDALGAVTSYSIAVTVQPPVGLANDTTGSVFASILDTATTTASQTSNVGQLFGTLNALQDSLDLALLNPKSAQSRRLLSFSAAVPAYVTQLNTQEGTIVASKGAQTDATTLARTATKQSKQTRATTAASVLTSGQSIIAQLVAASQALPTQTDQARAAAQDASTSIITLAAQQLAVIQLAVAEANLTVESAEAATTLLLNNISAQCDSLSATSLNVAGQLVSISASSSLSLYAGCDSATETAQYAFSQLDNTTVTFPAYSLVGAQTADASLVLANSSSQLLDSRVFYMPADPYVWALLPMAAISPVVYAARVSSAAQTLESVGANTVTMVFSLPVDTDMCPSTLCTAVCAVWDASQSMWNSSSSAVQTSDVYLASSGQAFIDCSVYSSTATSAAVMGADNSQPVSSGSSTAAASSSATPALSSSSAFVRLSSSSSAALASLSSSKPAASSAAAMAASSSSSSAPLYPAGSQQVGFYLSLAAGVNVSSPAFRANLTMELATNLAGFYNVSEAEMLNYFELLSVSLSGGARRRLLQAASNPTATVSFVIYSTISALGSSVSASDAAHQFVLAAAAGTLSAPYGSTIPPQTATAVDANGAQADSSSSGLGGAQNPSSASSNTGLALGLGLGLGIPALVLIAAAVYFFAVKRGTAPVANGMLHQRLPAGSASQ